MIVILADIITCVALVAVYAVTKTTGIVETAIFGAGSVVAIGAVHVVSSKIESRLEFEKYLKMPLSGKIEVMLRDLRSRERDFSDEEVEFAKIVSDFLKTVKRFNSLKKTLSDLVEMNNGRNKVFFEQATGKVEAALEAYLEEFQELLKIVEESEEQGSKAVDRASEIAEKAENGIDTYEELLSNISDEDVVDISEELEEAAESHREMQKRRQVQSTAQGLVFGSSNEETSEQGLVFGNSDEETPGESGQTFPSQGSLYDL